MSSTPVFDTHFEPLYLHLNGSPRRGKQYLPSHKLRWMMWRALSARPRLRGYWSVGLEHGGQARGQVMRGTEERRHVRLQAGAYPRSR